MFRRVFIWIFIYVLYDTSIQYSSYLIMWCFTMCGLFYSPLRPRLLPMYVWSTFYCHSLFKKLLTRLLSSQTRRLECLRRRRRRHHHQGHLRRRSLRLPDLPRPRRSPHLRRRRRPRRLPPPPPRRRRRRHPPPPPLSSSPPPSSYFCLRFNKKVER